MDEMYTKICGHGWGTEALRDGATWSLAESCALRVDRANIE